MINLFRRRSGPRVRLETERFVLDSLTRRELAGVSLPWTSDPAIMEPLELAAGGWSMRRWEKQLAKSNNRDRFHFGIRPKTNLDATIGYEGVVISRTNVAMLTVAIGDRSWWGKGVVMETRLAVLTFLFEQLQCDRAWGIVFARNLPSISNYLALGFAHEGTLRDQILLPGPKRGDGLVFGMTRQDWIAARQPAVQPAAQHQGGQRDTAR